jgi:hypothetical protein
MRPWGVRATARGAGQRVITPAVPLLELHAARWSSGQESGDDGTDQGQVEKDEDRAKGASRVQQ